MASDQPVQKSPVGGLGFRPDVQGIRAVAVMIVVLNHLFAGRLPGGFVGVDVFLVISGYLITALMMREAERTGRISLGDFYARRARRILPAATVVIVVTVIASLVTLALLRTRTVLLDAAWSTFFLANVRMASVGTDYFAQDQPPSPLRHYWSLAVEEQFYLVWPLLLALIVGFCARRFATRPNAYRGVSVLLLTLVVIASLLWSIHATANTPTTAYYSTFTRAHELAIGALLAFVPQQLSMPRRVREALAAGGLVVLLWSCFAISEETPFPGSVALVPVLATVALVLAGQGSQEAWGTRLLGVRPAVKVGDWSYSLYLWHWPVIVIVGANLGPEAWTTGPKILTLAGVLVISWASYRWIENPFRRARLFRSARRGLAIYPASVLLALAVVVSSSQVVQARLGGSDAEAVRVADHMDGPGSGDALVDLVRASVAAADEGHAIPGDLTPALVDLEGANADLGDCDYTTGVRELCPMGDVDADRDLVILGDSLARAISPAQVRIGEEFGYRVHILGFAGCPMTSLVQVQSGTKKPWQECEEFKSWALDTVADLDPAMVMVATSSNTYFDPETDEIVPERENRRYKDLIRAGWTQYFEELKSRTSRVVVISDTPSLPMTPGECLSDGSPDLGACTFETSERNKVQSRVLLQAAEAAGVEGLDASRWFCAEGRCPMVVGEFITLRDTHHVTPDYAREIALPMATVLGLT